MFAIFIIIIFSVLLNVFLIGSKFFEIRPKKSEYEKLCEKYLNKK